MAGAAMTTLWEPQALAAELGVTLPVPGAAPNKKSASGSAAIEPVDLDAYPTLCAELEHNTGDRSADTYRIAAACYRAGLTDAQSRWVVRQRRDLRGRLDERGDDDFMACWLKVINEQQKTRWGWANDDTASGRTAAAKPAEPETPEGMPRLWKAADLKPGAQPRWLAKNRLLRAAINLLIGDEGIGKSLLWVWLVAAITTGKPLPAFGIPARAPLHVILVCTEDDWTTTVEPRLEVAGADLDMISVICTDDDGSGAPIFPRDLFLITEAHPAPALVVVDAWLDTVPAALSVRDPQQARQTLHPWKELGTVTDAAVLLLCHTNRVASANARDRYGATIELRKKARLTLFAQTDEDGNLTVGPEKANTAATVAASKFTITAIQHFPPTDDHDGTVPLLTYLGESTQTAREQLADNYAADHDAGSSDDAVAWLAAVLAGGPRWSADVHGAREEAGISEKKLKSAKKRLNVASERTDSDGPWFMRLPQHVGQIPGVHMSPVSDHWTSGTSGTSGPLLEGFQKSLSTSQEGQRVNGERQGTCGTSGLPPTTRTSLSHFCVVDDCGQQLQHPDSIERGICERCWLTSKRTTDDTATLFNESEAP
jgi:hypothetical protein